VEDRPGGVAPPAVAAPSLAPPPPDESRLLGRYRILQVISIILVVAGIAGIWLGISLGPISLDPNAQLPTSERALLTLAVVGGGGLAIAVGLVMNAVRAVVVREALPASRYRGPSIVVLLLLATIVTAVLSIAVVGDVLAFEEGGEVSVGGALLILTATQMGLVAVAMAFVAIPRALAGVRLLPPRGTARSILLGLGLAIPAWIGATTLGYILTRLLELLGRSPEVGVVEEAIARLDPTVLILAVILVAPVAEELFFRGVVLNAWLREYGERRAILGSAALFAAIHANPTTWDAFIGSAVSVVPIFGLGLALAVLYRRTGSLLAAMALHAGFNAISLTLALLARLLGWELPT
jgi:membrane protease YdiL (CAAX protease family)